MAVGVSVDTVLLLCFVRLLLAVRIPRRRMLWRMSVVEALLGRMNLSCLHRECCISLASVTRWRVITTQRKVQLKNQTSKSQPLAVAGELV